MRPTVKSDEELLREAEALDAAYAAAAAFDAEHHPQLPPTEEEDDEYHAMDELRRAALNHRGQP